MKSEKIGDLAKALSIVQGKLKPAFRNVTNPFFKKKYADLESIVDSAKKLLSENGLAITQLAISENNQVGVETILLHDSGQWLSSQFLLPISGKNLAQAGGSIISYARRYSYASILGIVTGEDNDAQQHQTQQATQTIDNQQSEAMGLMAKMGLVDPDASIYAQNKINAGASLDKLLSHLVDLSSDGYRWDIISKQFLKK